MYLNGETHAKPRRGRPPKANGILTQGDRPLIEKITLMKPTKQGSPYMRTTPEVRETSYIGMYYRVNICT